MSSVELSRLAAYRKETGTRIVDICRESNLSREMVYRIERGDNVTIKLLQAYCRVLGLRIAAIYNWPVDLMTEGDDD